MLLELTDGRLRDLLKRGLTPWEILLTAYLEGIGVGHEEVAVPVKLLTTDLLLPSSTQTRLLKGLVDKGIIEVHTGWTGRDRRHVRFKLDPPQKSRGSAGRSTTPKSTTRSTKGR